MRPVVFGQLVIHHHHKRTMRIIRSVENHLEQALRGVERTAGPRSTTLRAGSPLRYPGFPVEVGGVGELHAGGENCRPPTNFHHLRWAAGP